MVVGRVRIGHQYAIAASSATVDAPAPADRQLRPRQSLRHVGEEAVDLGDDAGGFQLRGDPPQISRRACWLTRSLARSAGQSRQRRRHDVGEDPRALTAAEDQELEVAPRRAVSGGAATLIAGRTGLPVWAARAWSAGRRFGKTGGDPPDTPRQTAVGTAEHGILLVITVGTPSWIAASIVGTDG